MTCRVPVVMLQIPNMRELITSRVNGYFVINEKDDFSEAIVLLDQNKELCKEIIQNARQLIEKNYYVKSMIKHLNKVYQVILYDDRN